MNRSDDSSCSSSFSSSDMDLERREALLVEKYGQLKLKQTMLFRRPTGRKYFDSGDWCLKREGKVAADCFLDMDVPIESLPVKSEPTPRRAAARSHMDAVVWPERQVQVTSTRTVIDI